MSDATNAAEPLRDEGAPAPEAEAVSPQGGRQRRREKRPRHGLAAAKTKVKLRGLDALDMRTAAAQAVVRFRQELEASLGGRDALSTQQAAVVDLAARTWALLGHVDAYLFERGSLVDKRRRQMIPVLKERQSLSAHLAQLLGQLGLERKARPVPAASLWTTGGAK